MKQIKTLDLGLIDFREVWALQKESQQALIQGEGPELLILCRHNPVITLGTSAKAENVLADEQVLAANNTELVRIERGGDVTFHGPGQIVLYPILNLNLHKRDVDWYMRSLEEVIIRTLNDFAILGERIKGKTGVWIKNGGIERKIASIGIRISRWRTMHGLALNVKDCSSGFALINPCGYHDIKMTSIEEESEKLVEVEDVAKKLLMRFHDVFGYNV